MHMKWGCKRAARFGGAAIRRMGLLALGAMSGLAMAAEAAIDELPVFSLGGFGTLGATRSSSSQAHFLRDASQPDGASEHWTGKVDSLLGVQANFRLLSTLGAVVQGVSRYRYDKSFRPEITWAYLKYDPNAQVSLRLGRLGTEFFMLADSRLVGYSYLSVRPPVDYFFSLPFYSIDGVDAVLKMPLGEAVLRAKVFHGFTHEKISLGAQTWELEGSWVSGANLDYMNGPWQARLGYARIRFQNDLPDTSLFPELQAAGTTSNFHSLGLTYDRGPWQLQWMLNQIQHDSQAFEKSHSAYVLGGYRVGSLTPYLGYSRVASHSGNNFSSPIAAMVVATGHIHQHTRLVGMRWDFATNMALKAQWDAIRGRPDSVLPFTQVLPGWTGRADIFSLTLDFVF